MKKRIINQCLKTCISAGTVMLLGLTSANAQKAVNTEKKAKSGFIIKSYKIDSLGYGFDILDGSNDKVIVRQTIIPCVQGIYRFGNDADAQKMGVHMAKLMAKGVYPPTVTVPQMDSIKVSLTFVKPSDIK